MNEHRWIRVTAIENLPMREGRPVLLGDREIALFNLGDRILATDNQCPHKGGPLCDGIVTGDAVVCPLHGWKVNLTSGVVERPSQGRDHCLATYPTRVEDGVVLIGFPVADLNRRDGASTDVVRRDGASAPSALGEGAAA